MKYIIFDIDGTLTDTKEVEGRCFMTAFEQTFGLDITSQKWADFKHVTDWGITEEIIEKEFNRKPNISEYKLMISNFIQQLEIERKKDKNQFQEISGAQSFFNDLKTKNEYQLGIATGAWEQSAVFKLESVNINIENIIFSNSSHFKSREAITLNVIQQLKSQSKETPEEIIYFGDGVWDFNTCRKLGIRFIGIDFHQDGKLEALGAKDIFRNYLDKDRIIDCLNGSSGILL